MNAPTPVSRNVPISPWLPACVDQILGVYVQQFWQVDRDVSRVYKRHILIRRMLHILLRFSRQIVKESRWGSICWE